MSNVVLDSQEIPQTQPHKIFQYEYYKIIDSQTFSGGNK